jgi:hypothetical protein
MTPEKTTFYAPGTLTTWFKTLFRMPATDEAEAPVVPTLAERRAALDARERERARWAAECVALDHRVATARTDRERARVQLLQAEALLGQAETERLGACMSHDARVRRLEAQVRAGASAHLAVFLRDVRDQLEALRAQGVLVHEHWGRPDMLTDKRAHVVGTNAASVERRRAALMAAYRAAEALELEPLDEEAVLARLTALRDEIPAAESTVAMPVADPLTPYERREIGWRQAEQEAQQ